MLYLMKNFRHGNKRAQLDTKTGGRTRGGGEIGIGFNVTCDNKCTGIYC